MRSRTPVGHLTLAIGVAVALAVAEMILRLNEVVHAPYYALFLVGPSAFALELWWDGRRAPAA